MKLHRRDFVRRIAEASGAALIGGTIGWPQGQPGSVANSPDALPASTQSGIRHIVVVTMENRSFDHFLGWLPNANGRQHNSYPTSSSGPMSTYPLAPDYHGCGHPNPDHSYAGGRLDYDGGAMDGWLLNPANDPFCIGFYNESNIPFLAALARHYTTLDHYFTSIMSSTYPNRLFMLAAQTDRLDDSLTLSHLPTIFDSLSEAGVSAGYYYNNLPFVALWGFKDTPISHSYLEFSPTPRLGRFPPFPLWTRALPSWIPTRRTTTNPTLTFAGAMRFYPPPSGPWRRAPPGVPPCSSSRSTKAAASRSRSSAAGNRAEFRRSRCGFRENPAGFPGPYQMVRFHPGHTAMPPTLA